MPGGRLAFTIPRQIAQVQLRQLKGEAEVIKQTLAATGAGLGVSNRQTQQDGTGEKTKKNKKEVKDITKEELMLRGRLDLAQKNENKLQEAYVESLIETVQLNEQIKAKEIGQNDAIAKRLEIQGRLRDAIEQERDARLEALRNFEEQRKQQKQTLQDIQIQYGLIGEKQAEEIRFQREINQLRELKFLPKEEIDAAIAKLKEMRELAKSFGGQVAKSFADVVKSAGDLGANLGTSFGNAFIGLGDQLAEFVTTGKASFADFARSVLADMSRILIQFAMFQTLKSIVPGGSALGKFLGFANGGIMTANGPLQLKRYAAGGIASSPQLAMFGEGSRPEAYVPLPDGRSIPVTMKGGGTGDIIVNVDASGSNVQGNESQGKALAGVIGAAVQAELIKQKKPGGILY